MASRWGERETRIFVKLYLSHECLWNQNHSEFRSKFHREAAIKGIVDKFAALANILLDVGAVRRKIKNLKSTYCQELKIVRRRSTPKLPYTPSLKWFNDFYRCFGDKKMKEEGGEQLDVEDDVGNVEQEIWLDEPNPTENTKEDTEEQTNEDPFTSGSYLLLMKTEPEDKMEKDYQRPTRKRKMKKQRQSSCDSDILNVQRIKKERHRSESKEALSIAKEDEFDIYGKYIAAQLREMGLQKALRLQLKIQSIVSEARMEDLSADEP